MKSIVGGGVEQKQINIDLLLNNSTNIDLINGNVMLKSLGLFYSENGTWISNVIDIGDNFKSFDKIITKETILKDTSIDYYVRVSSNGFDFSEWELVEDNSLITLPMEKFIQVKAVLSAKKEDYTSITSLLEYNVEGDIEKKFYPENVIPQQNSSITTGGNIIVSRPSTSGSVHPFKVFDRLSNTKADIYMNLENNQYYIGFSFYQTKKVDSYALYSGTTIDNFPSSWKLEGSLNTTNGEDGDWTELDYKDNQSWVINEKKEIKLSEIVSYSTYRITFLDKENKNSINYSLGRFELALNDIKSMTNLKEIQGKMNLSNEIYPTYGKLYESESRSNIGIKRIDSVSPSTLNLDDRILIKHNNVFKRWIPYKPAISAKFWNVMTSGGTITATSNFNNRNYFYASYAFDGLKGNSHTWAYYSANVSLPHHLGKTFSNAYKPLYYTISTPSTTPERVGINACMPKSWEFQGYTGSSWVTLHSYSQSSWSTKNTYSYSVSTNEKYYGFRLLITQGGRTSPKGSFIGEFEVMTEIEEEKPAVPAHWEVMSLNNDSPELTFKDYGNAYNTFNRSSSPILINNEEIMQKGENVFDAESNNLKLLYTKFSPKKYPRATNITLSSSSKVFFKQGSNYYIINDNNTVSILNSNNNLNVSHLDGINYSTVFNQTKLNTLYALLNDYDELYMYAYPSANPNTISLSVTGCFSPLDLLDGDYQLFSWTNSSTDESRDIVYRGITNESLIESNAMKKDDIVKINLQESNTENLARLRVVILDSQNTYHKWNGESFEKLKNTNDILAWNTSQEILSADFINRWIEDEFRLKIIAPSNYFISSRSDVNAVEITQKAALRTPSLEGLQIQINNTKPQLEIELKGINVLGVISDADNSSVQYNISLNGEKILPIDSEFTKLESVNKVISQALPKDKVLINQENMLKIEFRDSFGTVNTYQTSFIGKYSSLMFKSPQGEYYSNEIGEILKYLDFGIIIAGQITLENEIFVKNQFGYDLTNLTLTVDKANFPDGMECEISKSSAPFIPEKQLHYDDYIMKHDDEVSFFIRLKTKLGITPNDIGSFSILARADEVKEINQ